MKVALFLDIDGVLNYEDYAPGAEHDPGDWKQSRVSATSGGLRTYVDVLMSPTILGELSALQATYPDVVFVWATTWVDHQALLSKLEVILRRTHGFDTSDFSYIDSVSRDALLRGESGKLPYVQQWCETHGAEAGVWVDDMLHDSEKTKFAEKLEASLCITPNMFLNKQHTEEIADFLRKLHND